jgi:hypothetical protein
MGIDFSFGSLRDWEEHNFCSGKKAVKISVGFNLPEDK